MEENEIITEEALPEDHSDETDVTDLQAIKQSRYLSHVNNSVSKYGHDKATLAFLESYPSFITSGNESLNQIELKNVVSNEGIVNLLNRSWARKNKLWVAFLSGVLTAGGTATRIYRGIGGGHGSLPYSIFVGLAAGAISAFVVNYGLTSRLLRSSLSINIYPADVLIRLAKDCDSAIVCMNRILDMRQPTNENELKSFKADIVDACIPIFEFGIRGDRATGVITPLGFDIERPKKPLKALGYRDSTFNDAVKILDNVNKKLKTNGLEINKKIDSITIKVNDLKDSTKYTDEQKQFLAEGFALQKKAIGVIMPRYITIYKSLVGDIKNLRTAYSNRASSYHL